MFDLVAEILSEVAVADSALNCRASEIFLFFVESKLGFPHPFGVFFFIFLFLFAKQVLVGDCNCDLSFHLEHLILHIENHLLEHLLRIFRAVDQVIEICADQCGNTF